MNRIPAVWATLFLVGCSERRDIHGDRATYREFSADKPALGLLTLQEGAATDVLARVNDRALTRKQAEIERDYRLAALEPPPPSHRLAAIRKQMMRHVVEQFVVRSLLEQEADRQGIVITPEEEAAAYDQVRAQLPPGKTLEEILTNSPIGEAAMRAEFLAGLKINRLLAPMMTNRLPIAEDDLKTLCENTRHARHILVKVHPDDSQEVRTQKRQKAETIRKSLLEGGDFSALARQHSDCESRQMGGDLGLFPRGRLDADFEKAAFSQKPHEIGPVVETRFGYHVIEVLPLDRSHVEQMLVRQLRSRQLEQLIERLKTGARIVFHPTVAPSWAFRRPGGGTEPPAVAPSSSLPPEEASEDGRDGKEPEPELP